MPTSKHGAITATWESGIDFRVPARSAPARAVPKRRMSGLRPLRMPDTTTDLIELLVALAFVVLFLLTVWPASERQHGGFTNTDVTSGPHRS